MHLRSHVEQRRRSAARTRSWGGWFVGTKTKTEEGTDILISEVVAFGERAPGIMGNLNFCAVGSSHRSRRNVCWTTDWEMGLSSLSKASLW